MEISNQSWFFSIRSQIRERKTRLNTFRVYPVKPDFSALSKFVPTPSLFESLKQTIADIRQPPKIEMTAKPLEVVEIWSKHDANKSRITSLAIHIAIVVLLLVPVAASQLPEETVTSVMITTEKPLILLRPGKGKSSGGGGGGLRTKTPPSKGLPPRGADKQLVPPMVEPKNLRPYLTAEPTLVAPQLAHLPQFNFSTIGDPNGVSGPPSAGPGTGGGIGTGEGRGVGSGKGPGLGPGEGGGTGGGLFGIGGASNNEPDITEPKLVFQPPPEYTEEARRARISGQVEVEIVVKANGLVEFRQMRKGLGYGLDEKAVEVVKRWKFEPGKRGGKPVPMVVSVIVKFSLR